ncbi:hypothetical protein MKQ68_06830 [Chitinophaga horti]|uniref:YD repeat-containing protein n=1 Tax=Chitinophaga horti TaxID=2920382 RepID=A0ABY6J545_9BACT|nr:hypothetical protein [Chitinophaga horti]UYQ94804.1 hypothetical protein MKQ68_06830 [Chitinophaga horti]
MNTFRSAARMVLCACCLLLGTWMQGFGQGKDNPTLPVITPPSPEAASLGKYGVWPVSQYTGTPGISIPIYEININGFKLPVSLSYHASGVKIDEKASWVGTNWTLNAGGMVGRTIVGLDDSDQNGIANHSKFGSRLKSFYDIESHEDYSLFLDVRRGDVDLESDIYYYNFAGKSGKLIFDSTLNPRSLPANNLLFRMTPFTWYQPNPPLYSATYPRWEVLDEAGNIYRFGANGKGLENTQIRRPNGEITGQGGTAFYLTEIVLANKADTIYFEYVEKNERYAHPYTQACRWINHFLQISNTANDCPTAEQVFMTNQTLYNGAELGQAQRSSSFVTGNSQLRRITWRGGKVEFNAATVRQDMMFNTGRMLDSVVVYDRKGARIKGIGMQYAYVNGRYYLDTLRETGGPGVAPLKHAFGYIDRTSLPPSEPLVGTSGRNSNAQDHWGYYNGFNTNNNLLPSHSAASVAASYVLTARREVDTVAAQTGTLNKITYPTGGWTTFSYESNRFDNTGTANPSPPKPIIYKTAGAAMNFQQPVKGVGEFTIPFDQSNVSVSIHFNDYAKPPHKNLTVLPYVRIERITTSGGNVSVSTVHYWDAFDHFPTSGMSPNGRGWYDYSLNLTNLNFTAGTYRVTVNDSCSIMMGPNCLESNYPDPDPDDDMWIIPMATASIGYMGYEDLPEALPLAGGLRVKEIINYTGNNQVAARKRFGYSLGKMETYPDYYSCYEHWRKPFHAFCHYEARLSEISSASQVLLGVTQGAIVGYPEVCEWDLDAAGNNNGYTRYQFSYTPDEFNQVYIMSYWPSPSALDPRFPPNSSDYKRGLLQTKAVYKRVGNDYIKQDTLENKYGFNDNNPQHHYYRQRNVRIRQLKFDQNGGTPLEESAFWGPGHWGYPHDFAHAFYDHITSWVQLLSTEQLTYDENGANPQSNLIKYYYDNKNHMLPTRTERTASDGKKKVTYMNYASDYAAGTPFIDDMIANHIIAAPIEALNYELDASDNPHLLSGAISIYKPGGKGILDRLKILENNSPLPFGQFKFANVNQGILPFNTTSRNTFQADSRYKDRLLYPVVNSYGNIAEQHKVNDVKEVYLWGYKGVYPVAKLIGTDFSTAQSYISQTILDNAQGGDDAALRTELNKLRAIPGALVTTYTYKPLVGITSQTDVNGRTTFYEYDGHNRLRLIRDQDGNILKLINYDYSEK